MSSSAKQKGVKSLLHLYIKRLAEFNPATVLLNECVQ